MIDIRPSDEFLEHVRRNGVFFIFPRAGCELYWSSCIADGLQELEIPIFSNLNQYPLGQGDGRRWLFPQTSMPPGTAALVVGDISDLEFSGPECSRIMTFVASQSQRSVLLCMSDVVNQVDFPPAIPVFVAHEVERVRRRGRRIPWAFGLNRDVLAKVDAALLQGPRKRVFLRNFRPSLNQSVRQVLDLAFVKSLAKHFEIDSTIDEEGRFLQTHYSRLATSFGCLAYGGTFIEDLSRNSWLRARGHAERWIVGDDPVIIRWDSWRFWESIVSGCLTVTLDFDEYGFKLPIGPENGVHYIGLRFDHLDDALGILASHCDRLTEIAERGRHWAITYFAPLPMALRFLGTIERSTDAR